MSSHHTFLQRWKIDHAAHVFVFKNQAQLLNSLPPDFHERSLSTPSAQRLLLWCGDGLPPFQDLLPSAEQRETLYQTLYRLLFQKQHPLSLCTTWDALLQRYPSISYLLNGTIFIAIGDELDKTHWEQLYRKAGYVQCFTQLEPGTFFKTGESLSLNLRALPKHQIKIEWFGQKIESLWERSGADSPWKAVERIAIFPKQEFPSDPLSQAELFNWFKLHPTLRAMRAKPPSSLPKFLGPWRTLLWRESSSILDWMPPETKIVFLDDPVQGIERFWHFLERESAQTLQDSRWPRPPLNARWISAAELLAHPLVKNAQLASLPAANSDQGLKSFLKQGENLEVWLQRRSFPIEQWPIFLKNTQYCRFKWLFISHSDAGQSAFKELMADESWSELSEIQAEHKLESESSAGGIYHVAAEGLSDWDPGVISEAHRFVIVTEPAWMRHTREVQKHFGKSFVLDSQGAVYAKSNQFLENLMDLMPFKPQDYLVHPKHGVGRFLGLESMRIGALESEFCALEYAEGAKVYVPVFFMEKLHLYASASQSVELTALGSKKWEKTKEQAEAKAKDVAFLLLNQSAEKRKSKGIQIPRNLEAEQRFAEKCGFIPTPDQAKAIEAVLNDLAADQIMDRLVCGEVGFGKTEVALRAAFSAVSAKKQVMLLAPTTLLAQQHFDRFKKRFEGFAVRIGSLSRFCSNAKAQQLLQQAQEGDLDILIGTHRLLTKRLKFKNLALFILDEEHRFGVVQKDLIAALTHHVNRLTLTATPIPRTLSMAMHGLKDLSLIITPPSRRQPVKTIIGLMDREQCALAIQRELDKGGQVYYVNNSIGQHPAMVERFQREFPQARITYVHGKLPVKELERRMLEYYHGKIDLLVCSVIIETGIDVPNANTLIVEGAEQFGLAQLHQLRGRVGRSQRQAYAYFYDSKTNLGRAAQKRLDALAQFSGLGAGFMLAEQDLELRGAGDLLGEAQSGKGGQVGIGFYLDLVAQAVDTLQGEASALLPTHLRCEMDLGGELILSKKDVESVAERLKWYRSFALVETLEGFESLKLKLIADCALLSERSQHFLQAVSLRVRAAALGLCSIVYQSSKLELCFHAAHIPSAQSLSLLLQRLRALGKEISFRLIAPSKLEGKSLNPLNEEARYALLSKILDHLEGLVAQSR